MGVVAGSAEFLADGQMNGGLSGLRLLILVTLEAKVVFFEVKGSIKIFREIADEQSEYTRAVRVMASNAVILLYGSMSEGIFLHERRNVL